MSTHTSKTPPPTPPTRSTVTVGSLGGAPPGGGAHPSRGRWIAPAAALWWVAGAVVALAVTLTGRALPLGDGDPSGFGVWHSVAADDLTPWFAVVAVAGGALATWTWRGGRGAPVSRAARTATVVAVGAVLAGTVTFVDATILARLGYLPVTLVMAPFDPVIRAAFDDFVTPGSVLQTAVLGGGALLAASTVRCVRRAALACESCGRRHDGHDPAWTTPAAAARWGRTAALVAATVPALYAGTRIAWVLGIPLGFSPDDVAELAGEDGWIAALGLGGFALAGAVLTLGLFQRWGEVFPRWTIGLAGRRVPVLLAVVPATLVAVAVLPAGLSLVAVGLGEGQLALTADRWGAVGPMLLWPVWSVALGAATYAYWLRRRGTCRACGRR